MAELAEPPENAAASEKLAIRSVVRAMSAAAPDDTGSVSEDQGPRMTGSAKIARSRDCNGQREATDGPSEVVLTSPIQRLLPFVHPASVRCHHPLSASTTEAAI